jgi:HlyD family secretion protein
LIERFRSEERAMSTKPTTASLKGPTIVAGGVILLFFGGFGSFAALAPLAGAAIAPGVVSPDGNRKTVQHLEGGIVSEILVQDGSRVERGTPLLRLDATAVRAEHAQLTAEIHALLATQARLLAEQRGTATIEFPELLLATAGEPRVAQLLADEQERFATRHAALVDRKAILRQRIAQLHEEIGGLDAQIESQGVQLELIEEETEGVRELLEKGLERRPRLLALERAKAQIDGQRAANGAGIARARQAIAEDELQMVALDSERADEVAAELAGTRRELTQFGERLRTSEDRLARCVIVAPAAGTVVELRVHTPGGVIEPGDPLLDLVPDDELLIDARVAPTDIDAVHSDQNAQIHLLAYSSRSTPKIAGRVRQVSADALQDPRTGVAYYAVRVMVDRAELARLAPEVALAPGMPAEVSIETGERTLLQVLLNPLRTVLRRGLRES